LFAGNNEAGLDMCGQRCRAAIPHGHRKAKTFIGAVRVGGVTKPMVLDGPLNQAAFQACKSMIFAASPAFGTPTASNHGRE
jgi:hypothetical protein